MEDKQPLGHIVPERVEGNYPVAVKTADYILVRQYELAAVRIDICIDILLSLIHILFVGSGRSTAGTEKADDDSAAMRDYAAETEEKVRKLCESVEGVGRGTVTVAVTLECGYETVYAEDSERCV